MNILRFFKRLLKAAVKIIVWILVWVMVEAFKWRGVYTNNANTLPTTISYPIHHFSLL